MPDVTISVDGQEVIAHEGETILEVARRLGKHIPTLCHDPRLEPFTSCFVCLVELEGRPGFVPSCATKVVPNMKVRTDSQDVINARRLALELLLSAHEGDCVAPCRLECPANVDIQTYIAQIAAGEYAEAVRTIKRTNPFPSVCGRVCPHTCELQCRRNLLDEAMAINPLKRFVADYDRLSEHPYTPAVAPDSGKRVAVVGGGPAGLTAAYYLRQAGHAVTVFEKNEKAGGMLRYGIPRYRLPEDVLDQEIGQILALGVELRTGQAMGRDFDVDELRQQGFDVVFLAIGAWSSMQLGVPGEDTPGVMAGIDFLCRIAAGERPELGRRVVVVGGGNVAIDAARTARRLGADVTIAYRRGRGEMPAEPYEIAEAEEEGVRFEFLAAPVALQTGNGRVANLRAVRMALGEPDASGRRRPVPVDGSEFDVPADTVIAAIGQRPDRSCVLESLGFDRGDTLHCNPATLQTDVPWVFAGGDCASGAATAVQAIGGGRRAAISIDRFLNGQDLLPQGKPYSTSLGKLEELDDTLFPGVERAARLSTEPLDAESRVCSFVEVEHTIDEPQALAEARRCLECGCAAVESCSLRRYSEEYGANQERFDTQFRHRPVAKSHPLIVFDPNKCIVCGRCVRICLEQQGLGALGFVDRGLDTSVKPALGQPLLQTICDACGQCVGTCPTGALTVKRVLPKLGPYYGDATTVSCGFCGIGCEMTIETTGGRYVQVTTEAGAGPNRGNLCVDGSFGHRYLETMRRLRRPLLRQNDVLTTATWADAIATAARGLAKARDGKGVAVLVNGPLTNEDSYLLARMARTVLGTNRVGSLDGPAYPNAVEQALQSLRSRVTLGDLAGADAVWLIGADPFEFAPIAGIELLRAANAGVRVTIVGPDDTRLDEAAHRVLRLPGRSLAPVLAGMADAVAGDVEALAAAAEQAGVKAPRLARALNELATAANPVILCQDDLDPAVVAALGDLLRALHLQKRLLLLRRGGNSRGRDLMGLQPGLLPGAQSAADAGVRAAFAARWGSEARLDAGPETAETLAALRAGQLDGLLVVNTDPYGLPEVLRGVTPGIFTVVMGLSEETLGDVLLPLPSLAETAGTVFTFDGRLTRTDAAAPPAGGRSTFDVLADLAAALGAAVPWTCSEDVWQELGAVAPDLVAAATERQL
ncbi:MAG: FAD-dependent oxidoreductase [Anaerolineae bacterium]